MIANLDMESSRSEGVAAQFSYVILVDVCKLVHNSQLVAYLLIFNALPRSAAYKLNTTGRRYLECTPYSSSVANCFGQVQKLTHDCMPQYNVLRVNLITESSSSREISPPISLGDPACTGAMIRYLYQLRVSLNIGTYIVVRNHCSCCSEINTYVSTISFILAVVSRNQPQQGITCLYRTCTCHS